MALPERCPVLFVRGQRRRKKQLPFLAPVRASHLRAVTYDLTQAGSLEYKEYAHSPRLQLQVTVKEQREEEEQSVSPPPWAQTRDTPKTHSATSASVNFLNPGVPAKPVP